MARELEKRIESKLQRDTVFVGLDMGGNDYAVLCSFSELEKRVYNRFLHANPRRRR